MKLTDINLLPLRLLQHFGTTHGMALSRPDTRQGTIVGCSSFDPVDLIPVSEFKILDTTRRQLGVHSILVCAISATPELGHELGQIFDDLPGVENDIFNLLANHDKVLSVYVVSHFNPNDKPCGSLTVSIGGDCYREDQVDFHGVLKRTALLARAMGRKAVINLPDIPVLHGGKKGEWILIDGNGRAIQEASEAARVALGSVIIKRGIEFLNRFKRQKLNTELGEVAQGLVNLLPDSASPDTLSGKYWPSLCRAWRRMGVDTNAITCLTDEGNKSTAVNGYLKIESALPTGYGVAATTVRLIERLVTKPISQCSFLVEALGNVSFHFIHALINRYRIHPSQITAFDPSTSACERAEHAFPGIKIFCTTDERFYKNDGPEVRYDVWVNNGLGNRTTSEQVNWLLDRAVRVFCGGANNFLRKKDELESLQAIWERGGWAWPDEAASGGGWIFAVMDLHARTLGRTISAQEFADRVIDHVEKNNTALVEVVTNGASIPKGEELWERIAREIDSRIANDLGSNLSVRETVAAANPAAWHIY